MDLLSGDITNLVFSRIMRANLGQVSLDGPTLNLLMQLDGHKKLSQVGQALGLSMIQLRTAIAKLLELKLIEPVMGAEQDLKAKDFLDSLSHQFALAVGPIASVLIEDAAIDMDFTLPHVPLERAAELVEMLATNVPRPERRLEFQTAMLEKIKDLGL